MPLGNDSAPVLTAHALTPDEFAPFGEVVSTDAAARRSHFRYAFEASERAVQPAMWVSYPSTVSSDEVEITKLERHPHAAQTFIPIREGRYLVVVCQSAPDGSPDVSTLRALIADEGQAVTYRRDVWHHGLTVLDTRSRFAVVTTLTGEADDDTFFELGEPVRVRIPEPAVQASTDGEA
ncbi:ureidoglycolate lyase [Burkholderia gladioli]|uniref:ureidoglycolate lyase n=1 Tax=Burkholderia gladioli TaxID=28095 RepID=UPI001641E656|nr:ureidoglycolate lyase [Burkholderia gladioli]